MNATKKRLGPLTWVVAVVITLAWGSVAQPLRAAPAGDTSVFMPIGFRSDPAELTRHQQEAAYRDVATLLNWRQRLRYDFLREWSAYRLQRLHLWLDLGVSFEGEWAPEELQTVIRVLDAYGSRYGERRLSELIQAAIRLRGNAKAHQLAIVKEAGYSAPSATWHYRSGKIVLNDGVFDPEFLYRYYYWSFLPDERTENEADEMRQEAVIAHELGHVVVDGLRAEAIAAGYDDVSLEGLYRDAVPADQWPHGYARTKESLVTEVGLWALGIDRTPEVNGFRTGFVTATVRDREWPHEVTRAFDQASASGSR